MDGPTVPMRFGLFVEYRDGTSALIEADGRHRTVDRTTVRAEELAQMAIFASVSVVTAEEPVWTTLLTISATATRTTLTVPSAHDRASGEPVWGAAGFSPFPD